MLLSCHLRVSEWIYTCSCLNIKKIHVLNRHDIWILSDSNGNRTHNHLVRKRTLDNLAKLATSMVVTSLLQTIILMKLKFFT